ncbi:hypothetical protein TWF225_000493 [Orbilia oligospora]|nr:hypothetical protein TWF225_000493 [Orbilia oligospora]KAF3268346.1 hypothetical protein TWF217_010941 [Orbilia oligospora]
MLQAADYLQIKSLRHGVLKHLTKVCETKLCGLKRHKTDFVMEELLDNFSKICELCHKSELELLGDIAKSIACHWEIDVEGLLDTFNDGTYGNMFLAVMLGVHRSSRCGKCPSGSYHDVTVTLDCLQRSTIFTAKSSNSHEPNDNPNDRLPLGFSLKSVSKVITSHNLTDFVTIRYYTFKGFRMGASQSSTNFMKIYNNEEFSDVIATVGTLGRGKKSYHLHQAIIRTFSEPLDAKCRAAPTEMGRKIITIDSWDHTIMDIVFRWMYGKNDLPGEQLDLPGVTMLIKVAQELEVKGLKEAALKTAVDITTSSIPTMHCNNEHWTTYWDTVETVCSLTNTRNFEDMDILFGLMEKIPIDKIQLDGARFEGLVESDKGLLMFLVSAAFRNIVEKTLCKDCKKLPVGEVTRSDSSHCSRCLKILPASK